MTSTRIGEVGRGRKVMPVALGRSGTRTRHWARSAWAAPGRRRRAPDSCPSGRAQDPVCHAHGPAVGIYVHEPCHEVRVRRRRRGEQRHRHRPERRAVARPGARSAPPPRCSRKWEGIRHGHQPTSWSARMDRRRRSAGRSRRAAAPPPPTRPIARACYVGNFVSFKPAVAVRSPPTADSAVQPRGCGHRVSCRWRRNECRSACAGSVLATNSCTRWVKRRGSSMWGKCPAPSNSSRRLPGRVSWALTV